MDARGKRVSLLFKISPQQLLVRFSFCARAALVSPETGHCDVCEVAIVACCAGVKANNGQFESGKGPPALFDPRAAFLRVVILTKKFVQCRWLKSRPYSGQREKVTDQTVVICFLLPSPTASYWAQVVVLCAICLSSFVSFSGSR